MSYRIQQVIHALEVGAGAKLIKFMLALIGLLAIATVYDLVAFRNLSTAEGMDAAQVAQRIADGKGFSTGFVRPFSLYLLQKKANDAKASGAKDQPSDSNYDPALLTNHPDISNAPAFPVVLAAALKLNPFGHPDVTRERGFAIYTTDLWLAGFNQLLIVIGACLVFRLGCRLFDPPVGWVSGILFAGTEIFWRSSMAGVPVAFLAVIFLLLFQTMLSLQSGNETGMVWRALLPGLYWG